MAQELETKAHFSRTYCLVRIPYFRSLLSPVQGVVQKKFMEDPYYEKTTRGFQDFFGTKISSYVNSIFPQAFKSPYVEANISTEENIFAWVSA